MEFALPELLTRDAILNILCQRQLNIRNLNALTHEELMDVYKSFVMPLSRRPERPQRTYTENILSDQSNKYPDYEEQMQIPFLEPMCSAMDIDLPSVTISTNNSLLKTHCRMTSPIGEKRRQISSDNEFDMIENEDQDLSSATKRIKINC